MSYKARVVAAAQEILKCRVKDFNGPRTKIVALPLETYAKLRKELKIEVISVIQQGVAQDYAKLKLRLPSENGISMEPGKHPRVKSVAAQPLPQPEVDMDTIPEPPVQTKGKQEGEDDKTFRSRRMKEGKALKIWRETYATPHVGAGAVESVPESQTAGNGSEGETAPVSFDPDGAPGIEAAPREFDPVKEQIEVASMEALLNRKD